MKTKKINPKAISGAELDRKIESGENIDEYFEWSQTTKTVNVDMPVWMIKDLDKESKRQGISRQALIKTWLATKLDALNEKKKAV